MTDLIKWSPFHSVMKDFINGTSPVFHLHHNHHLLLGDDIDFSPPLDLKQDEKGVEITLDVPGMDRKDITISVENGILMISGEKEIDRKKEMDGFVHTERSYGRFERRVQLPSGVNENQLKAEMKNGVLKLTAPIKAVSKPEPKKITIT